MCVCCVHCYFTILLLSPLLPSSLSLSPHSSLRSVSLLVQSCLYLMQISTLKHKVIEISLQTHCHCSVTANTCTCARCGTVCLSMIKCKIDSMSMCCSQAYFSKHIICIFVFGWFQATYEHLTCHRTKSRTAVAFSVILLHSLTVSCFLSLAPPTVSAFPPFFIPMFNLFFLVSSLVLSISVSAVV